MEANVIMAYTDKLDMTAHLAGEVVELDEERAKELSARGFVSVLDPEPEQKPEPETEPEPEPEPEADKPKPRGRRAPAKKG